jgi:acetylornithine/succinyldiaminopimelate/putrescine aminotransferase
MGRTGKFFAFEHFEIVPDILTLGKALGGGMPIGALVSSQKRLLEFTHAPMLGHITTFGGHPVVCAAAAAAVQVLKSEINWTELEEKAQRFEERFKGHSEIVEIRRIGMMFAFDMVSAERVERVVSRCMEKGLITFWFLSHPYSFRLSPPLTITEEELNLAADLILECIEETRVH